MSLATHMHRLARRGAALQYAIPPELKRILREAALLHPLPLAAEHEPREHDPVAELAGTAHTQQQTGDAHNALDQYTGVLGSRDINAALRDAAEPNWLRRLSQTLFGRSRHHILGEALSDAIDNTQPLARPIVVFRGLRAGGFFSPRGRQNRQHTQTMRATAPGDVLHLGGIISTTHHPANALGYAGDLMLEIVVRQGLHALAGLGPGYEHRDQHEFLMAHGTKLRVLGHNLLAYKGGGGHMVQVPTVQLEQIFDDDDDQSDEAPPRGHRPHADKGDRDERRTGPGSR